MQSQACLPTFPPLSLKNDNVDSLFPAFKWFSGFKQTFPFFPPMLAQLCSLLLFSTVVDFIQLLLLITCASCLLVCCLKHKCHIFAVQKKKSNCYVLRCKDVLCKQRKKRIFLRNKNVVCYVNLIELSIKKENDTNT